MRPASFAPAPAPRAARRPSRFGWQCLLALGLWWLLGLLDMAAAQGQVAAGLTLGQFEQQDEAGHWQVLQLPRRWAQGEADRVRLRANFELPALDGQPWALQFDRLPPDHDLRINGQRVSGLPVQAGPSRRFSLRSRWIVLPAALLQPGRNLLELDFALNHHSGGVSAPVLGRADALWPAYRLQVQLTESLPYTLNGAAAGLALFSLLVWWLRRSEHVLGFFGALWLLISLRNMGYYVDGGGLQSAFADYLLFLAQCLSASLAGGLCRRPDARAAPASAHASPAAGLAGLGRPGRGSGLARRHAPGLAGGLSAAHGGGGGQLLAPVAGGASGACTRPPLAAGGAAAHPGCGAA